MIRSHPWFFKKVELDNWGSQCNIEYKRKAKRRRVKLAYTPEDTTDMCAVTDDGLGNEIKRRIVKSYQADLKSSSERLEAWKTGKVSTSERRILATKWLGDAWDDYCSNHQDKITKAFKHCGMYNAVDGSENHLIKIRKYKEYSPPKKEDEPE